MGRNLAKDSGVGQPIGRQNDGGSSNPFVGRGFSDYNTESKALLRCRKICCMATLNACTIREDSRTRELAHCAKSLGIEILGIQEYRQVYQAQFEYSIMEDRLLVTLSAWRNEAQAAVGRIGLLLSNRAKKAICDNRCCSSRIMLAVFEGDPATVVISAYSPTNFSEDCEIEQFYSDLRAAIQDTPAHNFFVILGDFNARQVLEDVRFP